MSKSLGPEDAALLAEIAATPAPEIAGTREARLERLANHPMDVFVELNRPARAVRPMPPSQSDFSSQVAAALTPVAGSAPNKSDGRLAVLRPLKATAPAVAKRRIYKEEKVTPFEPSERDRAEAVDVLRPDRWLPLASLATGLATAFLFWLLV